MNRIRAKKLNNKTFIQTLNVHFHENFNQWWAHVEINLLTIEIKYLFWINKISMNIFKTNDEIIILDCTYKTNRYNIFLIILIEITYFNILFYFDMCFLKNEIVKNYETLFRIIKKFFKHIKIFLSIVWFIDDNSQIFKNLYIVISNARHVLYVWHIENNVINNCKKFFTNKIWLVFFNKKNDENNINEKFQRLLYVINEIDLNL